jgi:hypothetical protein
MERPHEIVNMQFNKAGLLEKRNGFNSFSSAVVGGGVPMIGETGGKVRGIFSNGDELCIIGQRRLYTFSDDRGGWFDRGPISPCVGDVRNEFKSSWGYLCPDMSEKDGWMLFAAQVIRSKITAPAQYEWSIVSQVRNIDGTQARSETFTGKTGTESSRLYAPRCASCTGKLLLFFCTGDKTGPNDLDVIEVSTSAPETISDSALTFTTNLKTAAEDNSIANVRMYDAIGLSTGDYLIAWIDATNSEIIVRRYNSSHVQQDTDTITAHDPYRRVTLAEGAGDQVYILAETGYDTTDKVVIYSRKRTDLTTDAWGPAVVIMDTLAAGERATNLGAVEGRLDPDVATDRIVCTYYVTDSDFGDTVSKMCTWSCDSDSTNQKGPYEVHNVVPTTRPMHNLARFYSSIAFETWETDYPVFSCEGFTSSVLADIDVFDGTQVYNPVVAAVYDFGISPSIGRYAHELGSANNVVSTKLGTFTYRHKMMSLSIRNADKVNETQHKADKVEFDFEERVGSATVLKTGTLIGGGYVSYYSGGEVNELGWLIPPILHSSSALANGGSLTDATAYTYTGIYESFNSVSGVYHRSVPGPVSTITTSSPNLSYDIIPLTMPFSAREPDNVRVAYYRSGASGNYVRTCEPWLVHPNKAGGSTPMTLDTYNEDGSYNGSALYTAGGDIEASTPEGAKTPVIGIGRVWLMDMMRRDRIQFSDPYSPDTATEYIVAPEFNEAFNRVTPDGAATTGGAEMDDKMIVFTADSIYMLYGDGPSNSGVGDFPSLTLITGDSGCITSFSICKFAHGIMFRGNAGIYLLSRSLEVEFIGYSVKDETDTYPEVTSAVLVEEKNEVRFTCLNTAGDEGIVLVYNYILKTWVKWVVRNTAGTIQAFIDACMHNGIYYATTAEASDGIWYENPDNCKDELNYYTKSSFRCSWVQKAGQSGWMRVAKIVPLLKKESNHGLQIQLYKDFSDTPFETKSFTAAEINAFDAPLAREQPLVSVSQQQGQAYSIRIEDFEDGSDTPWRGYSLSGIQFEIGVERGVVRTPEAQRI